MMGFFLGGRLGVVVSRRDKSLRESETLRYCFGFLPRQSEL